MILSPESGKTELMKLKLTAGVLMLLTLSLSCQKNGDGDVFASIEGRWKGMMAEMELKPFGIPIPVKKTDENFSSTLEFRSDGTLAVSDGSKTTEGTYRLAGDQLTTDIDLSAGTLQLSGTYTVETLTATSLVFYIKKKDTLTDPDTGQSVSGNIKVTLYFSRL